MKKMKKMKWLIIGGVAVIIIIAAALEGMKGIPVVAATVGETPVSEYVEARAKTTLPRVWTLCMPLDGRLMPITISPGEPVKKGQVVASLDTKPLAAALAEAKAAGDAIQGQININNFNALEKTAIKEAEDWLKTMRKIEGISQKRIEASRNVAEYAGDYRDSMVASGQAVSRLTVSKAKMEAAVADVDVESNELLKNAFQLITSITALGPKYINEYLVKKSLAGKVLESELAASQAAQDQAKRNLEKAVMTSPIDGVVLKRFFKNERVLPAGEPLLEIGDLKKLRVTADILSDDAVAIKAGDKVAIYGPVFGAAEIPGKVRRVDPKGFTKISSLGVEQQRVRVIIDFEEKALAGILASGRSPGVDFRVHVRVVTAEKKSALSIPRTALFRGGENSWQVFKIVDGDAVLTKVGIGLMNDEMVEVVSGLDKGDRVVIAPPTALANGDAVSVSER